MEPKNGGLEVDVPFHFLGACEVPAVRFGRRVTASNVFPIVSG